MFTTIPRFYAPCPCGEGDVHVFAEDDGYGCIVPTHATVDGCTCPPPATEAEMLEVIRYDEEMSEHAANEFPWTS